MHAGQNEEFFLKSVQYLFEDRKGWPRYAGDKGLVEGFMRNGYSAELARQRIATGCHWMAIPGREYPMNDIIKINTAKVLEVAFQEMMAESANPGMADLFARFEKHLRKAVEVVAEGLDFHLAHQKDNQPELLLNLLCHGPIEKGRDVSDEGVGVLQYVRGWLGPGDDGGFICRCRTADRTRKGPHLAAAGAGP